MTTPRSAPDVLYEGESTLRRVDTALQGLRLHSDELTRDTDQVSESLLTSPGGLNTVVETLARAYNSTRQLLDRIRESRSIIERASVERLEHMGAKLKEVTSATEVAATDLMDGIDAALAKVDRLDALAEAGEAAERRRVHDSLRIELQSLYDHMQFQDITAQQINYASSVIADVEGRLRQLLDAMAPLAPEADASATAMAAYAAGTAKGPATFDPHATTEQSAERQAVADALFRTGSR